MRLLSLLKPTGSALLLPLFGVGGEIAVTFEALLELVSVVAVVAHELVLELVSVDSEGFVAVHALVGELDALIAHVCMSGSGFSPLPRIR
jgi:hypothetical protein